MVSARQIALFQSDIDSVLTICFEESVFVSVKVKKYNKFDWKQERVFVVTEMHFYSLKGKSKQFRVNNRCLEVRRKLPLNQVAGLTVSKDPQSREMVIHVVQGAGTDIRFTTNK